jgi:UDP-N-acetylglucosamine diphosphorylase / glucose-1-phosphate thymidylyltransferase / UDP-N-acetylgalactosamine diphosphorylase / glucosamine-1-phosphate N-acetyltransferase / galactosamine-1-phosphate N-acetyltransferase
MPPLYVFEDSQLDRLFPLTYTRAACELRVGARTLLQRMARNLKQPIAGVLVRSALAETLRQRLPSIPVNPPLSTKDGILLVNARWLALADDPWPFFGGEEIPEPDSAGLSQNSIVWMHLSPRLVGRIDVSKLHEARTLETVLTDVRRQSANATLINRPWDLLTHQNAAIAEDFAALGQTNEASLLPGVFLLNPRQIHLARDVKIWPGAVLDAENGPIIVGQGTQIRSHAVITGPVAIGEQCLIRNQSDIREECSFGPHCRVGGEIINSVFLGYANKQHHGFLGQTLVGEWANLGAGTTTSNMKNNYGTVRMPLNGREEPTGRQFMGSVIGDHAKLGIGTYLSTGTVVGFASHVVVPRPPRFVPSFAWLTDKGMERADFEKLEQLAVTVMARRHVSYSPADHALWVSIASVWSLAEQYTWPDT